MQAFVRDQPPVVEIARHHERRVVRHVALDQGAQQVELVAAMRLAQAEMHADRMHRVRVPRHVEHAMQEAARFTAARCVVVDEVTDLTNTTPKSTIERASPASFGYRNPRPLVLEQETP